MGRDGVGALRRRRELGIGWRKFGGLGSCYNLSHIRRRGHRSWPCRPWVMELRGRRNVTGSGVGSVVGEP